MSGGIEYRQRMGFKQPSTEEHPEADVLTGMPTQITVLNVDLGLKSAVSQELGGQTTQTKVIWFPTGTKTASFTLDLNILNAKSNP